MRIRTITTGTTLQSLDDQHHLLAAAEFNAEARSIFEAAGFSVQDTRISTNRWEEYMGDLSVSEIVAGAKHIEKTCTDAGANFVSIGFAGTPEGAAAIPAILGSTKVLSTSFFLADEVSGISQRNIRIAAETIRRITDETVNGFGNFMFCAWANCHPWTPFYPAGYHEGQTAFSIGLENSDLLMQAFKDAKDLEDAEDRLRNIFEDETSKVEEIAKAVSDKLGVPFAGIDVSLNPSIDPEHSIAYAYEELGLGKFGGPGTLAISSMITRVLKDLPVKHCGYSGLMLPVAEDVGLAERADNYSVQELLLYSTVCGTGLDTIPLPGDVSVEKLESLLLDIASLSLKLDKPLSARLLPVPGKKAGELAQFNSPFLVDCRIFDI